MFAVDEKEFNELGYNVKFVKLHTITPFICSNLSSVETIEITGNSSCIANNAFQNCFRLEHINFKNKNINIIDDYAFENCLELTDLNINFEGKRIGKNSFYKCSKINSFDFLWAVEEFDDECLAYTNLSDFNFFNRTFKFIGSFAFANAYYHDNLNIKLNGVKLSAGAFHGMSEINYFEIKNCYFDEELFFSLFEKTKEEFYQNVNIVSLITDFTAIPYLFSRFDSAYIECNIENGNIPEGLFNGCLSLVSVKINGAINSVGKSCFECCENLEYIDGEFENNLIINDNAFLNCKNYEYQYFDKTKIIGKYAFYGSNLKKLLLGDDIEFIGDYAFGNCKLEPKITLPFIGNDKNSNSPFGIIFSQDLLSNTEVQIVDEKQYYIPNSIEYVAVTGNIINENAFKNCYFLKCIELPNVEKVLANYFSNCSNLNKLIFGSRLNEFSGKSLLGLDKNLSIIIENNDEFVAIDNSVFSKDQKTLYFSNKNSTFNDVLYYKPYSMYNISDEIVLSDVKLVESQSFDAKNVNKISLSNVYDIEKAAFINCNNIKNISISSISFNIYEKIFFSEVDELNLDYLKLDNISLKSIKNLFHGVTKLYINKLELINCELEDYTFKNVVVGKLIISNCYGSTILNNNLDTVVFDNSSNFRDMFKGINKFNTITISKRTISNEDLNGIECLNLILQDVKEIKLGSFENIIIDSLCISAVENIEKGAFLNSNINIINITNSAYKTENSCIYKDSTLLYYKPMDKDAKIPNIITNVLEQSIDLINSKSLKIPNNIIFDNNSIYHANNIETIICGSSNLTRLIELFDDCSNLKNIYYTDNNIPSKYLSNLPYVENIYLNKSIEVIGDFAFSNNPNLRIIENIEKAIYYGDFAFTNCTSLDSLKLNSNAESIGFNIIEGCSMLKSIEMPLLEYYSDYEIILSDIIGEGNSNISILITNGNIPSNMFENSSNAIRIENSPEYVGNYAFCNAKNVTIDLSNTVYIGECAFMNSKLMPNIIFDVCKFIGSKAFAFCDNIEKFSFNESLDFLKEDAFDDSNLESINIKNNLTYYVLEECVFHNENLIYYPPRSTKNIICFEEKINRIRANAFKNCTNLEKIKFTTINILEENSFNSCNKLYEVDLGDHQIDVTGPIFYNCEKLDLFSIYKIKQGSNNKLCDYFNNNDIIPISELTIYNSVLNEGELNCNNKILSIKLNDHTKIIPDNYFKDCTNLKYINFPTECIQIGDNAFENTLINEIIINENIELLGNNVFKSVPLTKICFKNELDKFSCSKYGIGNSLREIYFESTSFVYGSFEGKNQLEKIIVNKYIGNEIPTNCFSDCSNLQVVNIPTTYEVIKSYAFNNCTSLDNVYVPKHIKVEENAYYNCNGIKDFVYNYKNENFVLSFFGFDKNISSLNRVEVATSNLSESSFMGYKNIKIIVIHAPQNKIPSNCFKNCESLENVQIKGYNTIEESAFEGCKNLREFDLLNCEVIETNAFKECNTLSKVIIPSTITKLSYAYSGCYNIKELEIKANISNFKMANYGFEKDGIIEKVTFDNCTLGESSFEGYHTIKEIKFNTPITIVPNFCFSYCSNLKFDANFFNSIKSIGVQAFEKCNCIFRVNLPNVSEILKYSFIGCSYLKSICIGDKLKIISKGSFKECTSLSDVSLSDGLEIIEDEVFSKTLLKSISIPHTVQYIGSRIFEGNNKTVEVYLHDKKFDTSKWAIDWDKGFIETHSFLRFLNPKVKLKFLNKN